MWVWEWSPIYGWSSCWICSSRCRSGTSSCEHILGYTFLRRVPKIITKNIHLACRHVVHVHCVSWCPNGIFGA
uniref:Ureide permease 1-like n=1 Tax=Rhizophora mucronata TaxID=61149 RepID=A0A2P2L1C4_RHIMU